MKTPKDKRICMVPGCDRVLCAHNYCQRHYDQFKYWGRILGRTSHDPNEIRVDGGVAFIALYTNDQKIIAETVVDADDVGRVSTKKWCLISSGYVVSGENQEYIRLSRFIMNETRKGVEIDHRDRDKLNNRKYNLRPATRSQNRANSGKQKDSANPFKGVFFRKNPGKWEASICRDYKRHYLGYFDNPKGAAIAYDEAAVRLNGEFACTNKMMGLI